MGRHSNLPVLYNFCKSLSISELKKWKYLKPEKYQKGTITFRSFNYDTLEVLISVYTDPDNPFMELEYLINGTKLNYSIYFELVPSNLGKGLVWYFNCPLSGIRCRKLYLINGYFQHRTYKKGYYQTQTLGTKDKYLVRQFDKLQKSNKAKSELYNKYFKTHYNGKPTKRYLKLLQDIEDGEGVSEVELLLNR